jgi:thioredoxin 1
MQNITALNKDNIDGFLESKQVIVVYFWAEWCAPCKGFKPVFNRVAAKESEVLFGTVDIDAQKELAQDFHIRSVPTIMVFREHIALCQESGALPESALVDLINQAKGLEMSKVREEIAKQMVK